MLVSVLLTLLGLLIVDKEDACYGMGWNYNERQNRRKYVTRSSYRVVLLRQRVTS